ncbi:unnamed protein product [Didymodactylos carnosus]|uniref:Uncharacterized protein n=1 Tax=Didymodactylos carnosus TaxID=1234261 RepID=A0A814CMS6_9BILA|nr:unnamed protein product [Didymodactylos carnosus]CAF3718730.1 unnamed protein product [Didymodactylos carnosus]
MASDVTSLRQRLSTLVDTITRDIEIAETNRNLGTKHRLEQDLIQANQLARELEGQDILYGREFKQRIDTLRQRLDNLSRTPVYGAWNSGYDQEVDRLGHEQRDLLLRGHGSLLRTGDTLKTSHHIASETEQLGHEIMNDLTTQRETLLRVQDKLFYREYPLMELSDDACKRIQEFLYKILLFMLKKYPQRADLERWLYVIYPEAQYALSRENNPRKRTFPVDQLQILIQKEFGLFEMDISYMTTALEYFTKDLLKLAHNYVNRLMKSEISGEDISIVMNADSIFVDIVRLDPTTSSPSNSITDSPIEHNDGGREYNSYSELVRHFIVTETQYKDDIEMLIKLFRNPIRKSFNGDNDDDDDDELIDSVFGCLDDIYELTSRLLSDLEDAKEMKDDDANISLYEPFQNFIEGNEFECYSKYTQTVLSTNHQEYLKKLLDDENVNNYLEKKSDQFKETCRYLLPELLQIPIHHFQRYITCLEKMANCNEKEAAYLIDILSVLRRNNGKKQNYMKMELSIHSFTMPTKFLSDSGDNLKLNWKNSIENWDIRDSCHQNYLKDSDLKQIKIETQANGARERRALLFSTMLCLCKRTNSGDKWKLKEKIWLRKFDIIDRTDLADHHHLFEIRSQERSYLLAARSDQEKSRWMCLLLYIRNKSILQRELYNIRVNEYAQQVLLKPDPSYKFIVPDSPSNILIEYTPSSTDPTSFTIRGATQEKLIEYLTHHQLLHPRFVKSFLMTYKAFCTPKQLLDLLIDRYNIPEPRITLTSSNNEDYLQQHEQIKKFKKEYVQPVKLRVLNVIRQWVDKYFIDLIESDENILEQLKQFLNQILDTGGLYKFKTSIIKLVDKQILEYHQNANKEIQKPMDIDQQIEDLDVFAYDLKELADQITFICSAYFRAITSQELLYRLPNYSNLQNYMKFLDKVLGFWCKCSILETSNLDERVAVAERFIQIAQRTYEKKNFAAVFAIIFGGITDLERSLPHTWDRICKQSKQFVAFVDDMLGEDSHFKLYFEKLRQCALPVVPFIANNQTRISQMKETHNTILTSNGEKLINFRKFQQIGEHLSEIQQYQNMPYDIIENVEIQKALKRLNPMKNYSDETSFQNYLMTLKERIEPHDLPLKVFPYNRAPEKWRTPSRVARLMMVSTSSINSYHRIGNSTDDDHQKSSTAAQHRKRASVELTIQTLPRQCSCDDSRKSSSSSPSANVFFAFDNSVCANNDEVIGEKQSITTTTSTERQKSEEKMLFSTPPPPLPPRVPKPFLKISDINK